MCTVVSVDNIGTIVFWTMFASIIGSYVGSYLFRFISKRH